MANTSAGERGRWHVQWSGLVLTRAGEEIGFEAGISSVAHALL
jgi:hypothetical protein